MIECHDPQEEMLKRDYHLKCKIIVKDISYDDEQSKGVQKITEKMVFLKPYESTQRTMFFNAWLPETKEEHFELACTAPYPIDGFFKASIHRVDDRFTEGHYLFVMSRGAEEDFKKMNGRDIEITVLSAESEDEADKMKDFDMALNKNAH